MASLHKKKGRYFLQFFDASKRVKRKTIALKTGDRRTALTLKAFHEAEFALGRWSPWESPQNALRRSQTTHEGVELRSVQEAVEAFLESRAGCRQATRDHYRWVLSLFVETLPIGSFVRDLSATRITSWLVDQSSNANTQRTYLSRVGIFVRWCVAHGWIERDITKEVTLSRPPDRLHNKLIQPDQVDALIAAARASNTPHMAAIIMFAYDHALRLSEVCALSWDWIDLDNAVFTVRSNEYFTTKTGATVLKPLSNRCLGWIAQQSHRTGRVILNSKRRPLNPKWTSKAFKAIARGESLPESITFHSLRHGALSAALQGGASVEAVRRFAGHTSIEMTMRYVHLHDNAYLKAIRNSFLEKREDCRTT